MTVCPLLTASIWMKIVFDGLLWAAHIRTVIYGLLTEPIRILVVATRYFPSLPLLSILSNYLFCSILFGGLK